MRLGGLGAQVSNNDGTLQTLRNGGAFGIVPMEVAGSSQSIYHVSTQPLDVISGDRSPIVSEERPPQKPLAPRGFSTTMNGWIRTDDEPDRSRINLQISQGPDIWSKTPGPTMGCGECAFKPYAETIDEHTCEDDGISERSPSNVYRETFHRAGCN